MPVWWVAEANHTGWHFDLDPGVLLMASQRIAYQDLPVELQQFYDKKEIHKCNRTGARQITVHLRNKQHHVWKGVGDSWVMQTMHPSPRPKSSGPTLAARLWGHDVNVSKNWRLVYSRILSTCRFDDLPVMRPEVFGYRSKKIEYMLCEWQLKLANFL